MKTKKVLLTILENKDDDDEDGILPLNQSHLLRAQEENSPSPVQVDMALLEFVDRLAVRGSERDPYDPPVRRPGLYAGFGINRYPSKAS